MADGGAPHYYNEIDAYCAQWLRNLMDADLIPCGDIDTRSIEDVRPDELRGYVQCHFFAGIGGWPFALALAGWPVDRPVWTGSCPCQPFSSAGKGAGFADQRHLWPAWFHLIRECRPATIFGEQVASKAVNPWIDLVHAELEGVGYAFGCVPFPSAGVGAPHIRDRAYWMAHAVRPRSLPGAHAGIHCGEESAGPRDGESERCGPASGQRIGPTNGFWRDADWLLCRDGKWRPVEPGSFPLAHGLPAGMGNLSPELRRLAEMAGLDAASLKRAKSHRIVSLKGYGNAIVPRQAAEFIASYAEARGLSFDMQEAAA